MSIRVSTRLNARLVAAVLVGGVASFHALEAQAQAPAPAQSQESAQKLEYGFTAGYGHSDNVFRRSDDEIASDILTAGVELNWQEDRTRIDADVRADLDFNHYLNVDENFDVDNQLTGGAQGQVTLGIIPEHFTWFIEDSLGQTQQDPLVPATPETMETTNYLTTGPDFSILIGSVSLLRFSGRYSTVTYEVSPFDSARTGGGLTFLRNLSGRSTLALSVDADDVDYDDDANLDFKRQSASFNYTLHAARTDIDATFGYTTMDIEDGSEQTGPLVEVQVRRQVSNSSGLNLRFGTMLSDSAEALRNELDSGDIGNDDVGVVATSATFENQFASLAWEFERPRTTFDVSAGWDKDVYDTVDDLDRERVIFQTGAERHLNNRLSAHLRVAFDVETYETDDSEIEELRLILGGSWRFGRDSGVELWGERLKRDSNVTAGGGHSLENRIFVTFFYRPAAR